MLRALLFDFNGVLVDDEPIHLEMIRRVAEEEGWVESFESLAPDFVGLADRACFEKLMAHAGEVVAPAKVQRLLTRKTSYYRDRIREHGYPLFAGVHRWVEEAGEAGLVLGVVSNAAAEEVEAALTQAGLLERFKVRVTAEDVEEPKPSPQPYLKALEALNSEPPPPDRLIHPHEVLAVEDSPAGLDSASSAGLSTLAVAHSFPADALGRADLVVGGLEQARLGEVLARFAA